MDDSNSFLPPPEKPTQKGPQGICYDFNDGARVWLPKGDWRVELSDADSGNILFVQDISGGGVSSTKKYFVRFRIQVWGKDRTTPLLDHTLDLKNKPVLLSFPVGTLGDLIGWVPYAERFRAQHYCRTVCSMAQNIIDLFQPCYPELTFTTPQAYLADTGQKAPYATYRLGLFFGGDSNYQPYDFRQVGLHRTVGHILGIDPTEIVPNLHPDSPRTVMEPYVCIATMSTCQAKFWNNPHGWTEVIAWLKAKGYRVLCIDRERLVGQGFIWNRIPEGAEDFTGSRPLKERVALLRHADFFIGLSSGLSWLAWGCRIPVVLISGFTLPGCEFHTPHRVINTHVCNGCWDDTQINFDHKDFLWCPRHKNTERQYECTRFITSKQVINHLEQLSANRKATAKSTVSTTIAFPGQQITARNKEK